MVPFEFGPGGRLNPIYLDNHATTPVDPAVVSSMIPYLNEDFGNPGSRTHPFGRRAAQAVADARTKLATALGAHPSDVVFTSGATESNNLALHGLCPPGTRGHIITSRIEHHAVLDVCEALERPVGGGAWNVTYLRPAADGRVSVDVIAEAITPETKLVSIMWANNETGVINDVERIGQLCREKKIWFHCDAAQAVGRVPVDLSGVSIDLLSVSSHKFYGPKGVGALLATRAARRALTPLHQGGGQERGLRSGTLPVHQIVGLGEAARLAQEALAGGEADRLRGLRDQLLERLQTAVELKLNGSLEHRLPGSLNVYFPGCDAEALAMRCTDVAFSTGSACTSDALDPSYVILALTQDRSRAEQSIRLGLGRFNTETEVRHAAASIIESVQEITALQRPTVHGARG